MRRRARMASGEARGPGASRPAISYSIQPRRRLLLGLVDPRAFLRTVPRGDPAQEPGGASLRPPLAALRREEGTVDKKSRPQHHPAARLLAHPPNLRPHIRPGRRHAGPQRAGGRPDTGGQGADDGGGRGGGGGGSGGGRGGTGRPARDEQGVPGRQLRAAEERHQDGGSSLDLAPLLP